MNILIAGGRDFTNYQTLVNKMNELQSGSLIPIDNDECVIVSGMARGADALGVMLAKDNNLQLLEFPADWDAHGKSAGYKRNAEMSQVADILVAAWDGKSKGTKHMIDTMHKLGKPVYVIEYSNWYLT